MFTPCWVSRFDMNKFTNYIYNKVISKHNLYYTMLKLGHCFTFAAITNFTLAVIIWLISNFNKLTILYMVKISNILRTSCVDFKDETYYNN